MKMPAVELPNLIMALAQDKLPEHIAIERQKVEAREGAAGGREDECVHVFFTMTPRDRSSASLHLLEEAYHALGSCVCNFRRVRLCILCDGFVMSHWPL
jgi:hypothetical protein